MDRRCVVMPLNVKKKKKKKKKKKNIKKLLVRSVWIDEKLLLLKNSLQIK